MPRLNYETADAVIYDPVASHRNATRSVLYTLGFRSIEAVATLDTFNSAIRKGTPDLALCEAQGADAELCEIIQTLRQGTGGHINPFLVIIVTAWEKTNSLVGRVLNSGADDLILRPYSVSLLGQRIASHVERRKAFVITHDYVGPDRRNDPARTFTEDMFVPPNSLKIKAKDTVGIAETQARLARELSAARETLNSEKLRRDAFQICVLWRLLQEPDDPSTATNMAKLTAMTTAIAKRCRASEFDVALQWCESVLAAIDGLQLGVDHNASMHLLGHAALGLNQLLQPEKSKSDHIKTIERTVTMIRAREVGRASADAPLLETGSA
jgi:DNA-binding response OmpR family regulator